MHSRWDLARALAWPPVSALTVTAPPPCPCATRLSQRERKARTDLEAEVAGLHVKCQGLTAVCSESKASIAKHKEAAAAGAREREGLAVELAAAKKACAELQAAAAAHKQREQELQSTITSHTTSSAAGAEQVRAPVAT